MRDVAFADAIHPVVRRPLAPTYTPQQKSIAIKVLQFSLSCFMVFWAREEEGEVKKE